MAKTAQRIASRGTNISLAHLAGIKIHHTSNVTLHYTLYIGVKTELGLSFPNNSNVMLV